MLNSHNHDVTVRHQPTFPQTFTVVQFKDQRYPEIPDSINSYPQHYSSSQVYDTLEKLVVQVWFLLIRILESYTINHGISREDPIHSINN